MVLGINKNSAYDIIQKPNLYNNCDSYYCPSKYRAERKY